MKQKSKVVMLPTDKKVGLGGLFKKIGGYATEKDPIGKLGINNNPRVTGSLL